MSPTVRGAGALFVIGLLLALLAACGAPSPIGADLTDSGIKLSATTGKAGDVTFNIKNTSAGENHELVVLRTDLTAAQLPMGSDGGVEEDKLESMGEKGDIQPGQSADLTLKLPAGHYALICNEPGHYKAGMYTDFTVSQ